jgi:prevent-host-death family protein
MTRTRTRRAPGWHTDRPHEPEVGAGRFKATCLELIGRVRESGVSYTITKHGRPVARLVPIENQPPPDLFGCMKGTLLDYGDLIAPLEEAWDADED